MKLFFHICCAPCFIYPYFDYLKSNQGKKIDITGYFYNPNIHPYREFQKRMATLKDFAQKEDIPILYEQEYGLKDYLQTVYQENKPDRCRRCYEKRFRKTVQTAKDQNADAFTSTMLLSPYQEHDLMIEIAQNLSEEYDIEFYYKDWRSYYIESIKLSKRYEFYRQPYCGCVFSEEERYGK